jgi:hypothetical protein
MYTMKESVAVAKQADAKRGVSPTRSDNSLLRLRDEPEMQLGSLRDVIGNIRRNGGTPSVENIATQLSGMHTTQRAPVLLALQHTHGNRYVQRVVAGIQAKLKMGQPGDVYEQEADRVADAVMRMPEPQVQRQTEEEEELILTKPLAEQITPLVQRQVEEEEEVTSDLESRINSIKGRGQSLPGSARAFFEPRFGYNFSDVRIHTDAQAAESARAVNARAYTVGRDIVFETGQYAPGTAEGRKLLAHELTHVVQQINVENTASQERQIIRRNGLVIHERAPLMVAPLLPLIVLGGAAILAAGLLSGCSRSEREETTRRIEDLTPDDRQFIEETLRFFYRGQCMPQCINEQTVEVVRCLIPRASLCSEVMNLVPRPTARPTIVWLVSQSVKIAWRGIFRDRTRDYSTCVTGVMAGCSREFNDARISCEAGGAATRGVR